MRLIVIVLGILLFVQTASAFECIGVKLPSSIVICSDPELMRIADERQQAFNEARSRLSEQQLKELMADQTAWVRTYATACGVPADSVQPVLPASPSIKACFKRAGEARTAYIRSYYPSTPPASFAQPRTAVGGVEVPLVEANGVYRVPVLINGVLPLQFTMDSGAADVSIPADVFLTLIRTGTISEADYIGKTNYRFANGSTSQNDRFWIHELRWGTKYCAKLQLALVRYRVRFF